MKTEMFPDLRDKLIELVRNHLRYNYTDADGNYVKGDAVSHLIDAVSWDLNPGYAPHPGWRVRSPRRQRVKVTEDHLLAAGFKIIDGRNNRGQRCRIVTEET